MSLINCPTCGKRISDKEHKCPECSQDLTEFSTKASQNSNKKLILFPLIIIAIVAIIVIALIILSSNKPDNKAYNNETENATEKNSDKDNNNSFKNEEYISVSPVGVYDGDDHEKLIINDDGLAYYYCIDSEYSELACPWTYDGKTVNIELTKMHCTISASVKDDDFSELIFKTKSANWNTEVFTKINAEPKEYLSRRILAYDDKVTINMDGTLFLQLETTSFDIPKQFRNMETPREEMKNATILVDNNADDYYACGLLFFQENYELNYDLDDYNDKTAKDKLDNISKSFAERFFLNPKVTYDETLNINNYSIHTFDIDGRFNKGFSGLAGYNIEATLALIPDKENDYLIYILFVQTPDKEDDNYNDFYDILSSIKTVD